MALQGTTLGVAITASQTTFSVSNGTLSAFPAVGAQRLSVGVPMLIDSEFMYCVEQPVLNTIVVRGRGTESAATPHDILANVYISNLPGDFQPPQPGTMTTLDPAEDAPISIGQDSTITLAGATSVYNINKATACAITLLAPNLGDNGVTYSFTSNTNAAHTITATSLIQDASGVLHSTATFTANKGASVTFVAENGFLNVLGSPLSVTFS